MKMFVTVLLITVFVVVHSLCAEPQTGLTISGIVLDNESGLPIAGATITAVGNLGTNDERSDSEGHFVLSLTQSASALKIVRLRAQKRGYEVFEQSWAVSPLSWTPRLKKLKPKKEIQEKADKPPPQHQFSVTNNEKLETHDSFTVIFTPGPHSARARTAGLTTGGIGQQEVNIQAQPVKLFFDPPGIVLKALDLPKDIQIGQNRVTVAKYTSTGFTIDDHGIQGIEVNAFILEANLVPNGLSEQPANAPSTAAPDQGLDTPRFPTSRIAEGWTLHKKDGVITLTIIMDVTGFPSPLITAIDHGDVDIDSELREKIEGLWVEISSKVPPPKPVETIYGKIKGQQFWLHTVHYIDRRPDTLEYNYEILVNGSGIAEKPNTVGLSLPEMSPASRATVADLDALATHTANRRYIDAVRKISE